jgi:hypothetical protein
MICVPNVGTSRAIWAVCAPFTKNVVAADSQSNRCSLNALRRPSATRSPAEAALKHARKIGAGQSHVHGCERLRRVVNRVRRAGLGRAQLDVALLLACVLVLEERGAHARHGGRRGAHAERAVLDVRALRMPARVSAWSMRSGCTPRTLVLICPVRVVPEPSYADVRSARRPPASNTFAAVRCCPSARPWPNHVWTSQSAATAASAPAGAVKSDWTASRCGLPSVR